MVLQYRVVRINDLACYIESVQLDKRIALVAYCKNQKMWIADILYPTLSDIALMTIAKFVYKQNHADKIEYSLAT